MSLFQGIVLFYSTLVASTIASLYLFLLFVYKVNLYKFYAKVSTMRVSLYVQIPVVYVANSGQAKCLFYTFQSFDCMQVYGDAR